MKLKIEIEMDNAAFGGDSDDPEEVKRILRKLADNLPPMRRVIGWPVRLWDINGNYVGNVTVEEQPCRP
jgi:hypothetical protein